MSDAETGTVDSDDAIGAEAGSRRARKAARSAVGARVAIRRFVAAVDPLRFAGVALFVLVWQGLAALLSPIRLPPPLGGHEAPGHGFPRRALALRTTASLIQTSTPTCSIRPRTSSSRSSSAPCDRRFGGTDERRFRLVRAAIDPVMMTAGTVPILVAAPFLLIWFGVGRLSAVCLVIFYVTVILYLFAQRAANNHQSDLRGVRAHAWRDGAANGVRPFDAGDRAGNPRRPENCSGRRMGLGGDLRTSRLTGGHRQGAWKCSPARPTVEGIIANLLLLGLVAVIFDAVAGSAIARLTGWNAGLRSEWN